MLTIRCFVTVFCLYVLVGTVGKEETPGHSGRSLVCWLVPIKSCFVFLPFDLSCHNDSLAKQMVAERSLWQRKEFNKCLVERVRKLGRQWLTGANSCFRRRQKVGSVERGRIFTRFFVFRGGFWSLTPAKKEVLLYTRGDDKTCQ